jgi:RNA 3'-terminal phosphate cyclase
VHQVKTGAYVDLHTANNLILPCSLASGTSSFTISQLTMHTLTAVELAKIITGAKITLEGTEGTQARITIEGRNVVNKRFTDQV